MSRMIRCAAFVAAHLAATAVAPAQVSRKATLTLEGARTVLAACEAEAEKLKATGVMAVVDDGGNLIALHRLDGTFAAGANISIGKARTAALFRKPTKVFEDAVGNGRTAMVALSDFTPLQGGVPIVVDGQVVGAVGVSGAASAQQDEAIALVGAAVIEAAGSAPTARSAAASADSLAARSSPGNAVTYFDRARVAAAFEKGEPLAGTQGEAPFAVHASRRDGPGQAEVHGTETDVMYIQDGSATVVTGGAVVEGRETASGEVRGSRIEGGQTWTLGKGDVLIVPRGVPHWFKEVHGTLLYYVVKVRS